jgi:hypothetical protein
MGEWHLLKNKFSGDRHSGACRTNERSALNDCKSARRVSEANHPEDPPESSALDPACAGMTVAFSLSQRHSFMGINLQSPGHMHDLR